MLRRLSTLFCVVFLFALFLPLAVPNPAARAAPAAVHNELIRLAPVVVNAILPKALAAQTRDTLDTTGGVVSRSIEAAPESSATTTVVTKRASSHTIAALTIAAVVVVCVVGFFMWRRGSGPDETNYKVRGSGAT
jgi:hypothetical protein